VPHRIHYVMRCLSLWLIDYQCAVEGRRLGLFWHQKVD